MRGRTLRWESVWHAIWCRLPDEAQLALVKSGLDALPSAIPEIREYRHGADAGLAEGNFDLWSSVTSNHAAHQALISDVFAGRISARAAVRFGLEG